MNYDYVVIGGGVSGMTTALILAKHGCRVALVERSKKIAPTIRGLREAAFFLIQASITPAALSLGGLWTSSSDISGYRTA